MIPRLINLNFKTCEVFNSSNVKIYFQPIATKSVDSYKIENISVSG